MIAGQLSFSTSLCLALLHFLWQGTLIVATTLAIAIALRRCSSRARYAIHLIGLMLLPLAFVASLAWCWETHLVTIPIDTSVAQLAAIEVGDLDQSVIYRLPTDEAPLVAATASSSDRYQFFIRLLDQYSTLVATAYLVTMTLLGLRVALALCERAEC